MLRRPEPSEHAPYYGLYVRQVPEGDVLDTLQRAVAATAALLEAVPARRETFRYAPGKWSIREVVGHLIDVERTFAHRAFAIARQDPAPLPSFEQEAYAAASNAGERPLEALAIELVTVRACTLALFRGLPEGAWSRRGVASGVTFTVRSFPFVIAGHELHHRAVLVERYGLSATSGPTV